MVRVVVKHSPDKAASFPTADAIEVDDLGNLRITKGSQLVGVIAAEYWVAADVGHANPPVARVVSIKGANE